tara:strand:+ start:3908 stop:4630 length:723 start_codon:yes stop_codon:yes gene_type:complete
MALGDFITKIKGSGVARPNKYQVMVFPPAGMGMAPRDLAMMAESVSFPGQNLRAGTDILRHGPQREVIQGMTYGPFNMTFICTEGMPEKKFFEEWQEFSLNKETWEPRFYNDYVGTIVLESLDVAENTTYFCRVHEAYPKTINSQDFSYGATGAYQTISVEITYRWWESETTPVAGLSGTPSISAATNAASSWVNPNGNNTPTIRSTGSPVQPGSASTPTATSAQPSPATPNPADQAAGF